MVHCDKCLKDDEETVAATHFCKQCNMNYCDNHVSLHNSSNKTKSHVGDVAPVSNKAMNCNKCWTDDEEMVLATHVCKQCNMHYCGNHLNLHNSSNKTKSHVNDVFAVSGGGSSGGSSFVPFSGKYELVGSLGENEDTNFSFAGVSAIAIDPVNRSIFVSDRSTFFEFDLKTKKLKNHFKEPKDNDNNFLCYDARDSSLIYVIDRGACSTVVKLSRDGRTVFWENTGTHCIKSMAIDKVDGTIYVLQKDGIEFLSPDNGQVFKSLRHDLQGKSIFGLTSSLYSIALNNNNDLVILNEKNIVVCNKNGKTLKKYDRPSVLPQYGTFFEPNTNRIFCLQFGIDIMKEDGTCLTSFMNEKSPYKFASDYAEGKGADIALDSVTGELYCCKRGYFNDPNVVLVFK